MTRPENVTIKSMDTLPEKYLKSSLELVEKVFAEHADAAEEKLVRSLVEEIRAKKYSRRCGLFVLQSFNRKYLGQLDVLYPFGCKMCNFSCNYNR